MRALTDVIKLSEDDTLKNILIMAPLLDEAGQNRVFGLMCGLISNSTGKVKGEDGRSREKEMV